MYSRAKLLESCSDADGERRLAGGNAGANGDHRLAQQLVEAHVNTAVPTPMAALSAANPGVVAADESSDCQSHPGVSTGLAKGQNREELALALGRATRQGQLDVLSRAAHVNVDARPGRVTPLVDGIDIERRIDGSSPPKRTTPRSTRKTRPRDRDASCPEFERSLDGRADVPK